MKPEEARGKPRAQKRPGRGSTGQAKNPQLRLNLSEKLFEDETNLMNQETIKNLESFRKLALPVQEESSGEARLDDDLQVKLSFQSQPSEFDAEVKQQSTENLSLGDEESSGAEKEGTPKQQARLEQAWDRQFNREELTQLLSETKHKLGHSESLGTSTKTPEKPADSSGHTSLSRIKSQELFGKHKMWELSRINLESLENLGVIVDNKLATGAEGLGYFKTMAEAMHNLRETQTEIGRAQSNRPETLESVNGRQRSLAEPALQLQMDAEELYSINKSLYNSSKLFPPTEREGNFGSNLHSLKDAAQQKPELSSLVQFNSFKVKPEGALTERGAQLAPAQKRKLLSYFEVR